MLAAPDAMQDMPVCSGLLQLSAAGVAGVPSTVRDSKAQLQVATRVLVLLAVLIVKDAACCMLLAATCICEGPGCPPPSAAVPPTTDPAPPGSSS